MSDETDFGGELIELDGLSLEEVGDLKDSPFDAALRELLSDGGNGITAGFNAYI
jgi:hypothetical protein